MSANPWRSKIYNKCYYGQLINKSSISDELNLLYQVSGTGSCEPLI